MPALGTHVIQAKKCFAAMQPKIEMDAGFLGASAISHDTMGLLPAYYRCFVEAHEKKTDDYFLALMRYIKEEGLRENANAMAFLYGQLMHYALDVCAHPLIYYMTECHPAKFLTSALGAHTLFEAWYDVYWEEKEKAAAAAAGEDFDPGFAFAVRVSDGGINAMIDAVYETVYGQKNAAKGYQSGIKVWEIYQKRLRRLMLNHVKKYHKDFEGMLNPSGACFLHPVTSAPLRTTLDEAFQSATPLALELIEAADRHIYDGAGSEAELRAALGKSYDTGEDWRNPDPKRYFLGYRK